MAKCNKCFKMSDGTIKLCYECLEKRTKRLEDTMKAVCDYIKATGKVNKWKILNWLE